MAFPWEADSGPTVNAGLVALWFYRGSVAKKPNIFVIFQGGSNFDYVFLLDDEGREDPNTTIGPPAKRHLMAFPWRADSGPTVNTGLVALWFYRGSVAKKPYIFVIFQGGPEFFGKYTCYPLMHTMNHSGFTVSNFMEYSIGPKREKVMSTVSALTIRSNTYLC